MKWEDIWEVRICWDSLHKTSTNHLNTLKKRHTRPPPKFQNTQRSGVCLWLLQKYKHTIHPPSRQEVFLLAAVVIPYFRWRLELLLTFAAGIITYITSRSIRRMRINRLNYLWATASSAEPRLCFRFSNQVLISVGFWTCDIVIWCYVLWVFAYLYVCVLVCVCGLAWMYVCVTVRLCVCVLVYLGVFECLLIRLMYLWVFRRI